VRNGTVRGNERGKVPFGGARLMEQKTGSFRRS